MRFSPSFRRYPLLVTRYSFTLIELLIVIAVISIIAVAVNTDFLDFPVARAHYTARKIQSDIRYTQQLAMALQLRTRITFNSAPANTYAVEYENPPATWNAALDPISRQNFNVTLNTGDYEGVTINGITWDPANSGNKIIFDETGSPFDQNGTALAGNATIQLNANRNLVITPNTGKVEIT
ncbi:MAG: prepilin-type N-terminal cleavage/methylation domain-containing protein [Candidatus Omnitrophica bacterium]|nr:prepilin-type N-terminal cleavage/methylation domain-containing protein [Candidatus Omnitrophota bacterium]